MTWRAKAHPTPEEVQHATELLKTAWHLGLIEESSHIQYRGAMHPNYHGLPGEHPGVEVWTDIPADQYGATRGVPVAEDFGTSSIDEIETVLAAVEAVSNYPRDEVYSTIMIESGWKPHNYYHSPLVPPEKAAGGLIGFMPFVLKSLGWTGTAVEFRALSTAEQAPWVAKYFQKAPAWKYPGDTYVATAAGGYVGRPDDTVVYKDDPNKTADAWDLNKVWDINKDHSITVGELRHVLLTRMKKAPSGGTVLTSPKAPTGGSPSVPPLLAPVYYLVLSTTPSAKSVEHINEGVQDDEAVRVVQRHLKVVGLYKGHVDGDHGPLTEAAIRKFVGTE